MMIANILVVIIYKSLALFFTGNHFRLSFAFYCLLEPEGLIDVTVTHAMQDHTNAPWFCLEPRLIVSFRA